MTLLTGGFLPVCFVRSRSQTLVGEISALFFCCGVHDSIKKHGIKECAVEYRKMFYGPVMNKVTENRENQGTESNILQIWKCMLLVMMSKKQARMKKDDI